MSSQYTTLQPSSVDFFVSVTFCIVRPLFFSANSSTSPYSAAFVAASAAALAAAAAVFADAVAVSAFVAAAVATAAASSAGFESRVTGADTSTLPCMAGRLFTPSRLVTSVSSSTLWLSAFIWFSTS